MVCALISSLSLHDALPILPPIPRFLSWTAIVLISPDSSSRKGPPPSETGPTTRWPFLGQLPARPRCYRRCPRSRSEEHTSELQSLTNLVCRLLLEKKKKYA